QEKNLAIRHPRSALGKKCLQHLLHKGSQGVQLIIAIRGKIYMMNWMPCGKIRYSKMPINIERQ
uniref:hypothetical protein n=1 Tax=Dialister hominis TaxID=2582419 RepID=UPI003FEF2A30